MVLFFLSFLVGGGWWMVGWGGCWEGVDNMSVDWETNQICFHQLTCALAHELTRILMCLWMFMDLGIIYSCYQKNYFARLTVASKYSKFFPAGFLACIMDGA